MHFSNDPQVSRSESKNPMLMSIALNDRYIFQPKKNYGLTKAFAIFLFLLAWTVGIGLCLAYNETQQKEQEAAQPQEEMFDWKPIPNKKYPA